MSKFWRNVLSICIGVVFSNFGGLLVLIFWPLIFPESLRAPFWIDRATIHRRLSHEIESELESERAA